MDTLVITNSSVVLSVTNASTVIRDDFVGMEIAVKEPCFSCNLTDSKDQTTVQNPLSINGGFIAMAAGLSVVIPLICVLIIQLRRAKREERERARQAAASSGGESGGVDGPAADLPPTYEQLFGPDHVSPVHSRNGSLDALIEENETGHSGSDVEGGGVRNNNTAVRNTARASIDSVDSGNSQQVPLVGGAPRPNSALSTSTVSTVATISGSQVTDVPVNSTSLSQSAVVSSAGTTSSSGNSATSSRNSNANASTSTSTQGSRSAPSSSSSTIDYPPPPYTSPLPSTSFSAPSTSLPSSSSSGSAPPPPPPPPPPAPRSPPPPFSSWSHRRNHNPTNRNPNAVNNRQNSNSELSRLGQTLRRLPGMHISIEDFFASLRGLYDNNENDGPPPSYEEALKILESAKIAKENENRIH